MGIEDKIDEKAKQIGNVGSIIEDIVQRPLTKAESRSIKKKKKGFLKWAVGGLVVAATAGGIWYFTQGKLDSVPYIGQFFQKSEMTSSREVILKETTINTNWGNKPGYAIYYYENGKEHFVTQNTYIKNASFSPNGEYVVFESYNELLKRHEISVVTKGGEFNQPIVTGEYNSPRWKNNHTIEYKDKYGSVKELMLADYPPIRRQLN